MGQKPRMVRGCLAGSGCSWAVCGCTVGIKLRANPRPRSCSAPPEIAVIMVMRGKPGSARLRRHHYSSLRLRNHTYTISVTPAFKRCRVPTEPCAPPNFILLGIWGIFLNRKNIIIMLMSIELMLLAVNLNFSVLL